MKDTRRISVLTNLLLTNCAWEYTSPTRQSAIACSAFASQGCQLRAGGKCPAHREGGDRIGFVSFAEFHGGTQTQTQLFGPCGGGGEGSSGGRGGQPGWGPDYPNIKTSKRSPHRADHFEYRYVGFVQKNFPSCQVWGRGIIGKKNSCVACMFEFPIHF